MEAGELLPLDDKIKNEILRIWTKTPEVSRILLFGSRARGDADERSDIDLAVEAAGMPSSTWIRLVYEMEDQLNTLLPVDVIRLEEAGTELKENILREGKVLYERTKNHSRLDELGESIVTFEGCVE